VERRQRRRSTVLAIFALLAIVHYDALNRFWAVPAAAIISHVFIKKGAGSGSEERKTG